ncbi:CHASE2 domain-containing serine/threonine-protein kinase [Gloeobacter kilaueensis]|uniref:Serine/threonine protein kinase n=1 Tax=Gloeobacter kilaueensis (strain ATCC BAA-2537 / CCAP 1431/1 / ULC 316 / JS1) TaxID=1183438 RepID=U5QLU1_GLOK1|nr:CHASE2 domain-containing serine/threonine-protein kinase [Gloeobacter kilaueensis]AGY59952.1 serine/threonine protein kinase [Gloeobacter kilaueensis JS1]
MKMFAASNPARLAGSLTAALLGGLLVAAAIVGVRSVGWLEAGELAAYDRLMQWRPAEATDARLVLVEITESDRNAFGEAIPDAALARLLAKIDSYRPQVIGFDIYRPKPTGELAALFERNSRLVGIAKVNAKSDGFEIPPPPGLAAERFGFADVPIDESGQKVRRGFFYTTLKSGNVLSFGAVLALKYLEARQITLAPAADGEVALSKLRANTQQPLVVLDKLAPNAGGYQNHLEFARSYNLLINYRGPKVATSVTASQVLNGSIDPKLLRGRVVLVGYQGKSFGDYFAVPYTEEAVPGFTLHAQVVSELLSAVLDARPQIWYWNAPLEWLWIVIWSLGTAILVWRWPSLPWAGIAVVAVLTLLSGTAVILFGLRGWVPLVPAALAVVMSAGLVAALAAAARRLLAIPPFPDAAERQKTVVANIDRAAVEPARRPADWIGRSVGIQGRYTLRQHLGGGGMGEVFLATDNRIGREVALKILKSYLASTDAYGLKQRFLREVRISAALESTHIVQVSDFGITVEGAPFYVMEYLRGISLAQVLKREKRLPVERTVRILLQICEGLKPAHEGVRLSTDGGVQEVVRVVHRDLKPENIFLLGANDMVKILDFGIAKLLLAEAEDAPDSSLTRGGFLGSSRYASPEQWRNAADLDQRSDIYSLGMIGYEMLSGDNPFGIAGEAETGTELLLWYEGHLRKEPAPLRTRPECQGVPAALEAIVLRCLAKQPAERFATVEQLQRALLAAFPGLGSAGEAQR